ncbi:hypothetical protein BASA50_000260 [Batrachochytrium salamandrivorans]|uniref:Nudix hydrolase domain-containing protein n=1 Tax=Batrachochytrium salamandrivorans TaxID=1357716 RepID=A0ABQ8EUP5_9FUNG|nr:hypothetical protein BASA60_001049 [Batrachochytrium salamandrivorans]KAH6586896.1 hypothetical protein BASA50_000260 [Batrachochytrium salamandrivorans]
MATSAVKPIRAALRTAASLILCRPSPGTQPDFSILFVKRNPKGAFGGLTAFPGGAVSPSDSDQGWTNLLSTQTIPPAIAQVGASLAIAALRETFEECGYLLFDPKPNPYPDHPTLLEWRDRIHTDAAQYLVMSKNLQTCPGLSRLVYWANWITPTTQPKRFDTHFFMTVADHYDDIQDRVIADGGETVSASWMTPREALSSFDRKEITMLPPQYIMLRELAALKYSELLHMTDAASGSVRNVHPILPELAGCSSDGNPTLVMPGDEEHSSASLGMKGRNRITLIRNGGIVTGLHLEESHSLAYTPSL